MAGEGDCYWRRGWIKSVVRRVRSRRVVCAWVHRLPRGLDSRETSAGSWSARRGWSETLKFHASVAESHSTSSRCVSNYTPSMRQGWVADLAGTSRITRLRPVFHVNQSPSERVRRNPERLWNCHPMFHVNRFRSAGDATSLRPQLRGDACGPSGRRATLEARQRIPRRRQACRCATELSPFEVARGCVLVRGRQTKHVDQVGRTATASNHSLSAIGRGMPAVPRTVRRQCFM